MCLAVADELLAANPTPTCLATIIIRKPALVDEAVELGIYTRLANGEVQEEGRNLKRSKGEVAEAVAKFRIRNRQQGPGSDTVPQTQGRQPLPSTVERRAASARIAEKGAAANIPEQAKVKAYDLSAPLIDVIDEFDTCSQVELGKAPRIRKDICKKTKILPKIFEKNTKILFFVLFFTKILTEKKLRRRRHARRVSGRKGGKIC